MHGTERRNAQPSRSQESPRWADTVRELRAEYLRNSAAKLDAIGRLIERLEGQPSDKALGDLRTRFHGLHGSGLTYGFPAVSALGDRGEEACRVVIQADGTPSAGDFAEWHTVLDALHRELGRRKPLLH